MRVIRALRVIRIIRVIRDLRAIRVIRVRFIWVVRVIRVGLIPFPRRISVRLNPPIASTNPRMTLISSLSLST